MFAQEFFFSFRKVCLHTSLACSAMCSREREIRASQGESETLFAKAARSEPRLTGQ